MSTAGVKIHRPPLTVMSQTQAQAQGIALVSVLWVVALLAIVATGLTASVRSESRIVSNTTELLQAQYAVEGGVELAAMNLMYPQAVRWPADGSVRELYIGAARVRIATTDITGKIDINHAPAELLRGLLVQTNVEDDQIDMLVGAILDWRDSDDFRHLSGAEDSDYRLARLPYGAKDGRFDSVDELRLVLGMTEEIYASIESSLTIYSGQVGVNPLHASGQVSAALSGLDNLKTASGGTSFVVQVEARIGETTLSQVEATINITYSGIGRPYRILQWRQPMKRLFPDNAVNEFQDMI
jgi:general secretion pathway protein K